MVLAIAGSQPTKTSVIKEDLVENLRKQVAALTIQVGKIAKYLDRRRENFYKRGRSRSRSRNRTRKPHLICYYYRRF